MKCSFFRKVALGLVVGILGGVPAEALFVRSYDPGRHDRFTGFPANPVRRASFFEADVDLSGVGWRTNDTRSQLTLVSPKHVVGATHFRAGVGTVVRFLNRDGAIIERTVGQVHFIRNDANEITDLFVAEFTVPIAPADKVSVMPFLDLGVNGAINEADYVGEQLVVLGQAGRGGVGVIGAFQDFGGDPLTSGAGINDTRAFSFPYNTIGGTIDDSRAERGDSGSPSFVVADGKAALVGVHLAVLGTTATFDTFVPHYLGQLDTILADDGYNMTRTNTPDVVLSIGQTESADPASAGTPVSYSVTVENPALLNTAHNLVIEVAIPSGASFTSASGAGWVTAEVGGVVTARRGSLSAGSQSVLTLSYTVPGEPTGAITHSVGLRSDESAIVSASEATDIYLPFSEWADGLTDPAPGADEDNDGFTNLYEYAFGGNGADPSAVSIEGREPGVAFGIADDGAVDFRFIRRTLVPASELELVFEQSTDLAQETWTPVTASPMASPLDPPRYGFEAVEGSFPQVGERRFYRVRITQPE